MPTHTSSNSSPILIGKGHVDRMATTKTLILSRSRLPANERPNPPGGTFSNRNNIASPGKSPYLRAILSEDISK